MLEACPAVLLLSITIPLVPPGSETNVVTPAPVLSITQPFVLAPEQSNETPKKNKSVPPFMFGLKNSVMGEHRARVLFTICVRETGVVFTTLPVKLNV
jgi:hypothetical protein